MAENAQDPTFVNFDQLFGYEAPMEGEVVQKLPLTEIYDFPEHPYSFEHDDPKFLEILESYQRTGEILQPGIARPREGGGVELLGGYRRREVLRLNNATHMPLIVRPYSDDKARIVCVDSNIQREVTKLSEKARAYQMRLEAMNRQGQRTDLQTSSHDDIKLNNLFDTSKMDGRSVDTLAKIAKKSPAQIYRVVAIDKCIPELKELGDTKKIGINQLYELSHLSPEIQELVWDVMDEKQSLPNHEQAKRIRERAGKGPVDREDFVSILSEEKAPQKDIEDIRIKYERINKIVPPNFNYTPRQMEDLMMKLLDAYFKKRERGEPAPKPKNHDPRDYR